MSGVLLFFFGVLQRELPIPLFVPPFPVRPVSSPLSQFSVLVPVVCVRFLRPGFFVVRSPSVSFLVAFPFPALPQSPAKTTQNQPRPIHSSSNHPTPAQTSRNQRRQGQTSPDQPKQPQTNTNQPKPTRHKRQNQLRSTQTSPDQPRPTQTAPNQPKPAQTSPAPTPNLARTPKIAPKGSPKALS